MGEFEQTQTGLAADITSRKEGYVRNIFKYYVSYKLLVEIQEAQKKAREAVKKGG